MPHVERHEVTQIRRCETILKTYLVNLKQIWQIPIGLGVPHSRVFFQHGYGRNVTTFQADSETKQQHSGGIA
jgi:hypothetical protein